MDGTSKRGSRQLAQDLVHGLVKAYQSQIAQVTDDSRPDLVKQLLNGILTEMHRQLFTNQTATASYLSPLAKSLSRNLTVNGVF